MIQVQCPCGKRLGFQDDHAGRRGRCPVCQQLFTVPAGSAVQEEAPPAPAPAPLQWHVPQPPPVEQPREAELVDSDEDVPLAETESRRSRPRRLKPKKKRKVSSDGGFFGPEKAGIRYGVVGGVIMMAIAVVWFVIGLYCNRIFFYPPILFVIGVFAFVKGLATGNIAGNSSE